MGFKGQLYPHISGPSLTALYTASRAGRTKGTMSRASITPRYIGSAQLLDYHSPVNPSPIFRSTLIVTVSLMVRWF